MPGMAFPQPRIHSMPSRPIAPPSPSPRCRRDVLLAAVVASFSALLLVVLSFLLLLFYLYCSIRRARDPTLPLDAPFAASPSVTSALPSPPSTPPAPSAVAPPPSSSMASSPMASLPPSNASTTPPPPSRPSLPKPPMTVSSTMSSTSSLPSPIPPSLSPSSATASIALVATKSLLRSIQRERSFVGLQRDDGTASFSQKPAKNVSDQWL